MTNDATSSDKNGAFSFVKEGDSFSAVNLVTLQEE
jgi:hypothetical protein